MPETMLSLNESIDRSHPLATAGGEFRTQSRLHYGLKKTRTNIITENGYSRSPVENRFMSLAEGGTIKYRGNKFVNATGDTLTLLENVI